MNRLDNHQRVTLYGIYLDCRLEIKHGLKEIENKSDNKRVIDYRLFSKVVTLYFEKVFENIINGYSFRLYNHLGVLKVIKTNMIRYNPKTYMFKRVDGKVVREVKKLKSNSGYWYFVFWDCAKKYRHFRFKIDRKYKLAYMEKVKRGMDYLDLSLDGYGKKATKTYIDKIL